jgi:hypothetical protein
MIGNDNAELQGVLKAADHKEGAPPRQWAEPDSACRFFSH